MDGVTQDFYKGGGKKKSHLQMGWMEGDGGKTVALIGLAFGLQDVTSPQVLEGVHALTKEPGAAQKDGGSRG